MELQTIIYTMKQKISDNSNYKNSTIFHYLASRLRVATVTARFVVISDAGALVALRIQNQESLVLIMTNIRNGRSLYSIDQEEGLGTCSTGHSKSRLSSLERDKDNQIPFSTHRV